MSKGGAGKVYFVLYLAVILELLIIIVERDEAEEHLMKKQRESQRIVESILTQLQSGAGTEGINTRPQDEIVLTEKLPSEVKKDFKDFRTYSIEVGVTDVAGSDKLDGLEPKEKAERIETLKKLANVQELQYEIYYNNSKDIDIPSAPPEKSFVKIDSKPELGDEVSDPNRPEAPKWVLQASRRIELDLAKMEDYKEPVYVESDLKVGDINRYAPNEAVNSGTVFQYSRERTDIVSKRSGDKLNKRAFVVNFKPPSQAGWYKLRFSSRTNRILGLSAEQKLGELKEDAKVSIGTVQLKVKDLEIVKRDLTQQLEALGLPSAQELIDGKIDIVKFLADIDVAREKAKNPEERGKVNLYGYIARLLAPGRSNTFPQNKGSIEIDIRVQQPDVPDVPPVVQWDDEQLYSFDKAPKTVATFIASPFDKGMPVVTFNGRNLNVTKLNATDASGKTGKYKVEINEPIGEGTYTITATHSNGGKTASSVCSLTVFPTGLATVKSPDGGDPIENSAEIIGAIDGISYGDALAFEAIPTSGSKIPGNQFRIFIEGTTNKQPANRLSVSSADNYVVPTSSDKVSVRIIWQSPKDQDIKVQIFPSTNGPFETKPTQRKPSINIANASVSPMTDPRDPTIVLQNIEIKPPTSGADDGVTETKAQVVGVKIDVVESSIKGYSVIAVGEPAKNGTKYNITLRLKGQLPVPRGTRGQIKLKIRASAQHPNGEKSKEAVRPYNFTFSF
jgi:hypothetical protein